MANKQRNADHGRRYSGKRLSFKKSARKRRQNLLEKSKEPMCLGAQCLVKVLKEDKEKKYLWNQELTSMFESSSQTDNVQSDGSNIQEDEKCIENISNSHLVESGSLENCQDTKELDYYDSSDLVESEHKNVVSENNKKSSNDYDLCDAKHEGKVPKNEKSPSSENDTGNNFYFLLIQLFMIFVWLSSFLLGVNLNDLFIFNRKTKKNDNQKNHQIELRKLKLRIRKLCKRMKKKTHCLKKNILKNSKTKQLRNAMKRDVMKENIKHNVQGRRIIDFGYMWNEMCSELCDHRTKRGRLCSSKNWYLLEESRNHGGLRTLFCFKCKKCGDLRNIWSEDKINTQMNVNMASVLGIVGEGLGYEQVKGLLGVMNIPYISDKTFKTYQEGLYVSLQKMIFNSMETANFEEARLAVEEGNVDENGVPLITVVVDGSWLKRSYGSGSAYDSLSGCGAIIGERTGKVLYVGVMNKFCLKCDNVETKGMKAEPHNCVRNFPMNEPSTLMETYALLEGFKLSFEKYGVVYNNVIGDGDSSFFKRLIQVNPYKTLNIVPKKIECTNHLMRNLCKNIKNISVKGFARNKGYVTLRDKVRSSSRKIRQAILDEVDMILTEKTSIWDEKIIILRDRIRHIPRHIFGDHRKCRQLGIQCDIDKDSETENYIPRLSAFGLLNEIDATMWRTSINSESLLHKKTNNVAESLNNAINKLVSGKRINYVMSNQYNTRVYIAALQHNTQEALIDIIKNLGYDVPEILDKVISNRKAKVMRYRTYLAENGRRKKNLFKGQDKNYGPFCQKPDISEKEFEDERKRHYALLEEYKRDRVKIEEETREQSKEPKWINIRKHLLTASNFGRICRKLKSTSCSGIIKDLLYGSALSTMATKYGLESEKVARKEVSAIINKEIKVCGLFIDQDEPMFGASPDGLINDDGIFEVKSSYKCKLLSVEEAMKQDPSIRFLDNDTNTMKKEHKWYYQIIGQLHITRRKYCIFALRTDNDMIIKEIKCDEEFWQKSMRPHLKNFYEDCLLPEILDGRFLRSMPIRDPQYIVEAKQEMEQRKKEKKEEMEKKEMKKKEMEKKNEEKQCQIDASEPITEKITDSSNKSSKKKSNNSSTVKVDVKLNSRKRRLPMKRNYMNKKQKTGLPKISSVKHTQILEKVENSQVNDEVIYVSTEQQAKGRELRSIKTYFETKLYDGITKHVLEPLNDPKAKLNDDCMDAFCKIMRDNSDYEIQSVMYEFALDIVEPIKTKSLAFIKLIEPAHWRFAHFDGASIDIYDSLFGGRGRLCDQESKYLLKRFPNISSKNIRFVDVKFRQPDGRSCGVYSAAFATDIILNEDPTSIEYSKDIRKMKYHFLNILSTGKLSLFPASNRKKLNSAVVSNRK